MSKIIISGSAGHIGSNLCHWILENTEHEVVGIDNFSGGFRSNLPTHERFTNWYVNACDKQEMNKVFLREEPNICFHVAAYAAEGRSNYIRNFIHANNTVSSANVINNCVNYDCKLVFTSSVAVYSGTPPFTEMTKPNPIDEYALSKWTTEKSIQIAGEVQGLEWCIVRPRNVYGIRQNLYDHARNLFGIFCYNALNNLPLTIFGDGNNKRSFTCIDDIVRPLWVASFYDKQIINLGSEIVYTINQATEIFGEVTGYKNIIHAEERHEVKEAFCSVVKSKQLLDFEDNTTLYSGLEKMWQWAKLQPNRERQKSPALEITKNLHSSIV